LRRLLRAPQDSLRCSPEVVVTERQQVCERGPGEVLGRDAEPLRLFAKSLRLDRGKLSGQLHALTVPSRQVLVCCAVVIGRALDQWAYGRGVRLHFIAPGKPVQNAHIESFHSRFRDECLNESWFLTVPDARRIIEAWRQDYNTVRPHSPLGYLTPEEFEQLSSNGECETQ
jgi:Integrase core domain